MKTLSPLAMRFLALLMMSTVGMYGARAATTNSFVNWETSPVHPIALSTDGGRLAVCNLPDARLELFDVSSGTPVSAGHVVVGLDPVTVRFRTATEAWVVNHISDSVSVVDLETMRVEATLDTLDAPADVVFAGVPERAYVSCAGANSVQLFDPSNRVLVATIVIEGQRPKAMAVSPDRRAVYVAIFESGNASTILAGPFGSGFPQRSVVDFTSGPHGGQNPPANSGTSFTPAINPALATNAVPPRVGLIVKKNHAGQWMDDTNGDWTEFVSGTNALFSGRPPGWDVVDHDVAVISTETGSVGHVTGLMNLCMDLAVNPVTGRIAVVGTDALNHVRFEPVLRGIFIRVNLGLVEPQTGLRAIKDLNPHLDYKTSLLTEAERKKSVGDPRGIVWSEDGTRAYVTGMGSDNLIILDADGNRSGRQGTLTLGEGPTGLALDEPRKRLYVLNRFSATLSVVDTETEAVVGTVPLFDPTPGAIKAGRKHLYNTHGTSGLGQASCASCHVDARFDRLAWDLGDPPADLKRLDFSIHNFGRFPPGVTNHFHPMKGPMVTQTLQDIIGHEPFHWRGDRDGLEQFNGTFTNLQGAASLLLTNEMQELEVFLATIHFPPNPFRHFNNSLSTNVPLPGQFALGRGTLPPGQWLTNGNAQAGLQRFRLQGTDGCIHCHTLPSGLGPDMKWTGSNWRGIPVGTNGEHHAALISLDRSAHLPFKISHLRNLYDKIGMDLTRPRSSAGFGFLHDGSVDSLVRFVQDGFNLREDKETADLVAFLLSFTGSDLPPGSLTDPDRPPGLPGKDVPAAVGRQVTITNSTFSVKLITDMIALATSATGRVDLVVRGSKEGIRRAWVLDRATRIFQSDRNEETIQQNELRALAAPTNPLTYTVVPPNNGLRIGVDRDEDGYFNRTEIDFGSNPSNPLSLATNRPPFIDAIGDQGLPAGSLLSLVVAASDPDIPAQKLTFSLDLPVPAGATIASDSGQFAWRPAQSHALQTHSISVRVTDSGRPNRSSTRSFAVTVGQHPLAPLVQGITTESDGVAIAWQAIVGKRYRVQFKESLADANWTDLPGEMTADSVVLSKRDAPVAPGGQRYYRILLVE